MRIDHQSRHRRTERGGSWSGARQVCQLELRFADAAIATVGRWHAGQSHENVRRTGWFHRCQPRGPATPRYQPSAQGEIGDAAAALQINYTYVQFQQGITGNVLPERRELTFRDQVRSIYGPVPTWDAQLDVDMQELAPGDVSMNCEQLTVNREVNAPDDTAGGEMTASGNTLIEGRQPEGDLFTAARRR